MMDNVGKPEIGFNTEDLLTFKDDLNGLKDKAGYFGNSFEELTAEIERGNVRYISNTSNSDMPFETMNTDGDKGYMPYRYFLPKDKAKEIVKKPREIQEYSDLWKLDLQVGDVIELRKRDSQECAGVSILASFQPDTCRKGKCFLVIGSSFMKASELRENYEFRSIMGSNDGTEIWGEWQKFEVV